MSSKYEKKRKRDLNADKAMDYSDGKHRSDLRKRLVFFKIIFLYY